MPSLLPLAEHSSYSYMAFGISEDCLYSFSGIKVYKYLPVEVVWPEWGFPMHQVLPWQPMKPSPSKWSLAPPLQHKCIHLCGRRESLASANESCCLHVQYIEYYMGQSELLQR